MKPILVFGPPSYAQALTPEFSVKTAPLAAFDMVDLTDISAVLFGGGEDISPTFYRSTPNPYTSSDSGRDWAELNMYRRAKKAKLPTFGICRGMQFQCAMNGGSLIQHVEGHHELHTVYTANGRFIVNSIHHQMCYPWLSDREFRILAHTKNLSNCYQGGLLENGQVEAFQAPSVEPEAILWPATRDFGVQWHPELLGQEATGRKFFQEQVKHILETANVLKV